MPQTLRNARGSSGYTTVPYRHIDGQNYNALIVSSQALTTPTGLAVGNQGTPGTTTYGYRVSATGGNGETLAATEVTTTTGAATLNATDKNRLTWNAVTGASGYNLYRSTGGGASPSTGKIGFVPAGTLLFDDTGFVAAGAVPSANTSRSYNIWVPSLKPAGAGAVVKNNVPTNGSRTATGVIVTGR